jgi:glyoxylase-like metal-dependent hydrolase (beta-lactamase superfamily II)
MTIRAVHHLNCGTMCPVGGPLFGASGFRAHLVAHCLLIETERDGLVLVDTGFGTQDCAGTSGLSRANAMLLGAQLLEVETAVAHVEGYGYNARDVRHIVVTHLDMDHAGGIPDFINARVHLHALEHAAAVAPPTFREKKRYVRSQFAHAQFEVYSEDGDTWRGLPAITKLRGLDADIGLLPMHGHTRGHSAVLIRERDGWLVHAGDAYFHHASVDGDSIPIGFRAFESAIAVDDVRRRTSAAALRQLRERHADLTMFCSHDRDEFARAAQRTVRGAA